MLRHCSATVPSSWSFCSSFLLLSSAALSRSLLSVAFSCLEPSREVYYYPFLLGFCCLELARERQDLRTYSFVLVAKMGKLICVFCYGLLELFFMCRRPFADCFDLAESQDLECSPVACPLLLRAASCCRRRLASSSAWFETKPWTSCSRLAVSCLSSCS